MLKKNTNLFILSFLLFIFIFILMKLIFIPVDNYGLFLSGSYNIFTNYFLLLSILGYSLLLFKCDNKSLFLIINIFLFIFFITQFLFTIILELIFHFKIDLIFGFDRFPEAILYILNILIGILMWFPTNKVLYKYLISIIISFILSLHIGLKDIEVFSLKSFISYPGGNILIIIVLIGLLIFISNYFQQRYILVGSKILGSWIIVIGVISSIFSLIY
ncbi:MAG: hypothetical protein CFH33_00971 [Alphaproteobacteria bacterium MarineAlpha9_Bin3]|nr:MAG: hypothetical protein CFH33_00971 [Alphaproteobacteria bacterium MarineAlpha9_Bin3]|tara:strand:+ start:695 stop:1345 length:651 start_codon:yes stop_codon:yes gene_type:complete